MDDDDDENDADSTNLPLNLVATQFAEWNIHMQKLIVAVEFTWRENENKTKETKVFTNLFTKTAFLRVV